LELRLQKARSMLVGTHHDHMKVSDIALACGFNEVSYFNRCFRRCFGASPTEHRGAGNWTSRDRRAVRDRSYPYARVCDLVSDCRSAEIWCKFEC
jgi:AraC-like DNA-binding protein